MSRSQHAIASPLVLALLAALLAAATSADAARAATPAAIAAPQPSVAATDVMLDPRLLGDGGLQSQAASDWRGDYTDATPSHYYVWCNGRPVTYDGPRDAGGIVMVRYSHLPKPVYNPTTIAQYALHWYEAWLHSGDRVALGEFLRHARWLRDRGMDSQGRFVYAWDHPPDRPSIDAPWYSAMAQGTGMSVLTRAYAHTGDTSYLNAARRAVAPFTKDVSRGGVVTGGGKWLEEYPDKHQVLNGSLFAAFGLYDVYRASGDRTAKSVLDRFASNLADNLYRYESRGAILYEFYPDHHAMPTYYGLHNSQLRAFAAITRQPYFAAMAQRWETSFRAYPAPVVSVPSDTLVNPGTRVPVSGRVRYFYKAYYTSWPSIKVMARTIGTSEPERLLGRLPLTYTDATNARFAWVTPNTSKGTVYRFVMDEQPIRAPRGFRYAQQTSASFSVRMEAPALRGVGVENSPASPNGDGWRDDVYVTYRLSGSSSRVTLKVYDQAGTLHAVRYGRTARGGVPVYQGRGTYRLRYDLHDARGRRVPDGAYRYVLEASNAIGSTRTSGHFFVSRDIVPARGTGTRPGLWAVRASPTAFSPSAGEQTAFRFSVGAASRVTIEVFGPTGRVRTLRLNAPFPIGRQSVAWDGRDDAGRLAPPGPYSWFVMSTNGGRHPVVWVRSGVSTLR